MKTNEIGEPLTSRDGASRAHEIGVKLRDVLEKKLWRDLGYKSLTAYFSSLNVTRAVSYYRMRIARLLSLADCNGLTQDIAILICSRRVRTPRKRKKLVALAKAGASYDDLRRLVRGEALRVQ